MSSQFTESVAVVTASCAGIGRAGCPLACRRRWPRGDQVVRFSSAIATAMHNVEMVIRSGCYVTHDHGGWRSSTQATRPVHGRRMPVVLDRLRGDQYEDWSQTGHSECVDHFNDQRLSHVQQRRARCPTRRRSLVALGISHPCTTFDKWRFIPVVDGDRRVLSVVQTFS